MKRNRTYIFLPLLLLLVFGFKPKTNFAEETGEFKNGNTFYVAVDGNDEGEGTKDDPLGKCGARSK